MEIANLSRAEMEALRRLATSLDMTVEDLAQEAFREGLEQRFRLPERQARVIPFKGLSRPTGEQDG